jgi:hypothetical protein
MLVALSFRVWSFDYKVSDEYFNGELGVSVPDAVALAGVLKDQGPGATWG